MIQNKKVTLKLQNKQFYNLYRVYLNKTIEVKLLKNGNIWFSFGGKETLTLTPDKKINNICSWFFNVYENTLEISVCESEVV